MQLRLIDALHPSYPGYQVILKAGDRVSYQCHGFHKTETQTKIITLAQKWTFFEISFLCHIRYWNNSQTGFTKKLLSQNRIHHKTICITWKWKYFMKKIHHILFLKSKIPEKPKNVTNFLSRFFFSFNHFFISVCYLIFLIPICLVITIYCGHYCHFCHYWQFLVFHFVFCNRLLFHFFFLCHNKKNIGILTLKFFCYKTHNEKQETYIF